MILHLSPEAPFLLRAAASTALIVHIGGASLGIVSGFVALAAPKGRRLHRAAGAVFFVSMLAMSAVGAVVSPMLGDNISGLVGAFTFYLTATAWAVVRRRPGSVGRFEAGACLAALAVAAVSAGMGWTGSQSPDHLLQGQPYQIAYVLAGVAMLAAASDARMIQRGGLAGGARISRHLWRMCVALFIAAGSAAAQPRVTHLLPQGLRGPGLMLPALAVLVVMVFWLVRTGFAGRGRASSERLVAT